MISKSISPPVISPALTGNSYGCSRASWVVIVVKNSLASAGDIRDKGSIRGLGKSPGGGHGNSLQYSCLEKPMDKAAGWATVHGVTKTWTRQSSWAHKRALERRENKYLGPEQVLWGQSCQAALFLLKTGRPAGDCEFCKVMSTSSHKLDIRNFHKLDGLK